MSVDPKDDHAEAMKIIEQCRTGDGEADHSMADGLVIDLLRRLGYHQTANAWSQTERWYA